VSTIYLISNFALLGVLFLGAEMVLDAHAPLSVGALASYWSVGWRPRLRLVSRLGGLAEKWFSRSDGVGTRVLQSVRLEAEKGLVGFLQHVREPPVRGDEGRHGRRGGHDPRPR
jgi:hypothetical protein